MIKERLDALIQIRTLSAKKMAPISPYIENVTETPMTWEIEVIHRLFAGAENLEIAALEEALRQPLPTQLVNLLRISNGAELFCVTMSFNSPVTGQKQLNPRYQVLSTKAIARTYAEMQESASIYEDTREYFQQHDGKLDYIPFSALSDGHYLALHLETGHLFFLDRDDNYFPYGIPMTQQAYVHVADSIEDWLMKLVETNGFAGMGGSFLEKYIT